MIVRENLNRECNACYARCRREKKTSKMRTHAKLIDQLQSHKASKAEAKSELVCAICLENIRVQQVMITLPCKHEYHRQCILKWLKSTEAATCPCCKAPALELPSETTVQERHARSQEASTTTATIDTSDSRTTTADNTANNEEWWHT